MCLVNSSNLFVQPCRSVFYLPISRYVLRRMSPNYLLEPSHNFLETPKLFCTAITFPEIPVLNGDFRICHAIIVIEPFLAVLVHLVQYQDNLLELTQGRDGAKKGNDLRPRSRLDTRVLIPAFHKPHIHWIISVWVTVSVPPEASAISPRLDTARQCS